MTENGSIRLTIKNQFGIVAFHHPKGNSMTSELLGKVADAIKEAGKRDEVKVIILKSEGDGAFCGGASFDELLAIEDMEQGTHFFKGFALVLNAMRTCPKLIIVRVQGKAVGGGVGIAAAGDYTIAHESAAIKLSELSMGIGPFVIGPAVKRKIGTAAFSALALNAKNWHSADWACQKGMYQRVLQTKNAMDGAVHTLAVALAESNPQAMEKLKASLWEGTEHWDSLLKERAAISSKLLLSDHTKEFIAAFKQT